MEKQKNEMGGWLILILILMTISISIILYFRLPKSLNRENNFNNPDNEKVDNELIVVN